jgi:hypothetical protein
LSRRVHEAAVARNDERAAASRLSPVDRARAAKRRELEALDQALELHELAAQLSDSLGRPEQAAAARDRAERARLAVAEALREQTAAEELVSRRQVSSRRLPGRDGSSSLASDG